MAHIGMQPLGKLPPLLVRELVQFPYSVHDDNVPFQFGDGKGAWDFASEDLKETLDEPDCLLSPISVHDALHWICVVLYPPFDFPIQGLEHEHPILSNRSEIFKLIYGMD